MFDFPFLKNFKGFKLSRSEGELELQDIFLDKLVTEREIDADEYADRKLEVPLSRWFLLGLYGSFILIIFLFF